MGNIVSTANNSNPIVFFDLTPFATTTPISIPPTTRLNTIINLFRTLGIRVCVIAKRGRVCGVVTKKDVLEFMFGERGGRGRARKMKFKRRGGNNFFTRDDENFGDVEESQNENDEPFEEDEFDRLLGYGTIQSIGSR